MKESSGRGHAELITAFVIKDPGFWSLRIKNQAVFCPIPAGGPGVCLNLNLNFLGYLTVF